MGRMNWSRILLAGLLAGMVINTGEYLLHKIILQQGWTDLMQKFKDAAEPKPGQFAALSVAGFVMGVLTVWLFAAIRPRFASTPKAVMSAAIAIWIPGYCLGLLAPFMLGILPAALVFPSMAGGIVELTLGALLGGLIYADASRSPTAAAAAA
jgi:hypothetical protein